jgi:hypothetical protein
VSGPPIGYLDPEGPVGKALGVALEALEERVTSARWMLTDPRLYGLAEPDGLRRSLERDQGACALLRATFDVPGTAPQTDPEPGPQF